MLGLQCEPGHLVSGPGLTAAALTILLLMWGPRSQKALLVLHQRQTREDLPKLSYEGGVKWPACPQEGLSLALLPISTS